MKNYNSIFARLINNKLTTLILLLLIIVGQGLQAQNLGITDGSSFTPNYLTQIHLNNTSGTLLQLTNTTSGNGSGVGLIFRSTAAGSVFNMEIYNQSNGFITFGTNNTERIRVVAGGAVGIGTTDPTNRLHVYATSNPLRLEGLQTSTETLMLVVDADGVVTKKTAPTGTVTSVSASAPLASSGGSTPNITITQAGSGSDGYLTSTDWTTFNNKQATITGGATTITTSDLTFDRALISNGIGKVAVSPVTSLELGYLSGVTSSVQTQLNGKEPTLTKGNLTEATSSVLTITGGSSAVIGSGTTIQVKQASGSQDGFLSSANWTTFNNKQATITGGATTITTSNLTTGRTLISDGSGKVAVSSVTSTELGWLAGSTSNIQDQIDTKLDAVNVDLASPLSGDGTSGFALTITQATGSVPGYLTAADWTKFNNMLPKAGGTMTGLLTTKASVAGGAGLNLGVGATVSAPNNGDVWMTGTGMFTQYGGVTYKLLTESRNLTIAGTTSQIVVSPTGAQNLSADRTWTLSLADNAIINGNIAMTIPRGLTSERAGTTNGLFRYNTTTDNFEGYSASSWKGLASLSGNNFETGGFIGTINTEPLILATTNTGTAQPIIFKTNNTEYMRLATTGYLGIGTTAPKVKADVNGDFGYRQNTFAASNGSNNDINVGTYSFIRISSPTAVFTITGIANGFDGKIVTIYNSTSFNMTIANNSGSSSAANQIITLTGADISTAGAGSVTLQYSAADTKWIVIAIRD